MKSQPRRRPYRSAYGVVRLRTRPRLEPSSPTDRPPGGVGKFTAWTAGILASCLVAVAGFWINERGEDTVAELRGEPPLKSLATIKHPATVEAAFGRGPLSREDFAKLRLSDGCVFDLVDSYNGAQVKSLHAQIALIGGRNELTVLDIAVRHRIRRKEPLTGGFVACYGSGATPSEQITVNLDLQEPFFEVEDKPRTRYFDTKTVTLKKGETVVFDIDFLTTAGYHEFDLEATYLLGDKKGKTIIPGPDNGVFKITGEADDFRAYGGELYVFRLGDARRMSIDETCGQFPKSQGCK